MAILYKTDGTKREVLYGRFALKQMQELVGGYIVPIQLNARMRMIVDEDGSLKQLPLNEEATAVLRSYLGPNTVTIVGNALVGDRKEFGVG